MSREGLEDAASRAIMVTDNEASKRDPVMVMRSNLSDAISLGAIASQYQQLRAQHPDARAAVVVAYIRDDHGLTFEQYRCEQERGHSFSSTGTAYGGDEDSYGGEGRCYCAHCGADGDA
jgi:hypothetical protein